MREINYQKVKENVDEIINTLEFDAMRSPGKVKQNCDTLVYLYKLKEIYKPKKNTQKEG